MRRLFKEPVRFFSFMAFCRGRYMNRGRLRALSSSPLEGPARMQIPNKIYYEFVQYRLQIWPACKLVDVLPAHRAAKVIWQICNANMNTKHSLLHDETCISLIKCGLHDVGSPNLHTIKSTLMSSAGARWFCLSSIVQS